MARRKTRLARRPDSQNGQFEERVPAEVRDRLRGRSIVFYFPDDAPDAAIPITPRIGDRVRVSLRTADGALYARRKAALQAHLAALYEAARRGPGTLSHKTVMALSGEVYRLFVERFEEEPGSPAMWAAVKGFNRAAREGRTQEVPALRPDDVTKDHALAKASFGDALTEGINALSPSPDFVPPALERRFGWLADWVLAKHGRIVDAESRAKLIRAAEQASTDAALALKRNAAGDYTPDPAALRFPPVPPAPMTTRATALTFKALFELFLRVPNKRGQRRRKTLAEYEKVFTVEFAGFVRNRSGSEDPTLVTREDVIAWRDHLSASGLSWKTIKDKKIAILNSIYGHCANDAKIATNPASKIPADPSEKAQEREAGFTEKEAKAILRQTGLFKAGRHGKKLIAAIRWAPWLGAYTGARIAEITQLRGKDVFQTVEGWQIRFTPEAGSIKTNKLRDVPIHSHLLDLGFLNFVSSSGEGPLFYDTDAKGTVLKSKADAVAGRVSRWVRGIVADMRVAPTHGWRHRFTTMARRVGMDTEARSYILGHRLPGMGDQYGDMAGLHREIEKLPRIKLDDDDTLPKQDEIP